MSAKKKWLKNSKLTKVFKELWVNQLQIKSQKGHQKIHKYLWYEPKALCRSSQMSNYKMDRVLSSKRRKLRNFVIKNTIKEKSSALNILKFLEQIKYLRKNMK